MSYPDHGGELGSHLGLTVLFLPVLYAKDWAHVFFWPLLCHLRSQKGCVPISSRLTWHCFFRDKKTSLQVQVHTPLQLAWERRDSQVLSFCSPLLLIKSPGHNPSLSSSASQLRRSNSWLFFPRLKSYHCRLLMQSCMWVSSTPNTNLTWVKVSSCENILCCCLVCHWNYFRVSLYLIMLASTRVFFPSNIKKPNQNNQKKKSPPQN